MIVYEPIGMRRTYSSVSQIITVILFAADNNGVYVIADMLGHLTVRRLAESSCTSVSS